MTSPSTSLLPSVAEPLIEEELSYPILLSERVRKAALETVSFKSECAELAKQVDRLSTMLRAAVRATISSTYDRPIRRISADVSRNLLRCLSLLRRCRRRNFFHRLIHIVGAADFRKIFSLLDASAADLRWLLSILDSAAAAEGGGGGGGGYNGGAASGRGGGGGIILSLPPIASNDPILSWVWSFIATVQMAAELSDRIEAANELASLASDNDRNKKIIVEEGGVPPLLKCIKDGSAPDGQVAGASALYNLADDVNRVRVIVDCGGVPLIVHVLGESPYMRVQIRVSELIARMAEYDEVAKEDFARENVIRPLVSLLSFETFDDEVDLRKKLSFHSLVEISNKEKGMKKERRNSSSSLSFSSSSMIGSKPRVLHSSYSSVSSVYSEGGGSGGSISMWQNRKERENESPEVKRELKISSAKALWMLSKDSISNSRRITETKGLLCLAKLIEKEQGELHKNCVMTIMEITSAAESNSDLRRSAFKTNSPAAKAVIEQLLRVIKESDDPVLQIAGLKSIGSLSRTFPARETRVIGPLVEQLSNKDHEVATEAAIALGKFACPENFLCQEHSKAIIEFNGVLPLMRLLIASERAQVHGLTLLCYLAIHASDSEALEQARVLGALEGADRTVQFAQQPHLRELITKAIYHLNLYRNDVHSLRQLSLRI